MDMEHVAGISLAPRRLSREESDFAVGGGVLGHVVDDDQRVLAAITERFAIVKPENGAIHCRPGAADALATTKMQRSGAPWA